MVLSRMRRGKSESERERKGSLIQGDYKRSLNPRIFKRHPFQSNGGFKMVRSRSVWSGLVVFDRSREGELLHKEPEARTTQ